MNRSALAFTIAVVALEAGAQDTVREGIEAVPFTEVKLGEGFWAARLETNRSSTIPHIMEKNVETGRIANLEKGAGRRAGAYQGRRFNDTDVYKIVEAASYTLAQHYDAELDAELDRIIEIIAAAQEEDGYLFPARTVDPDNPAAGVGAERWIHVSTGSHELYNAGHLIEAAVAHHRATGKRSLLDVAVRFADLVDETFGPGKRRDIPGHEEVELALVKLADTTGERRYLELARFFLDQRGAEHDGELYPPGNFAMYNELEYKQDHVPVIEQVRAVGHAVRAMYLYTGMADVAARLEPPGYLEALEGLWNDVVSKRLYITGGVGARGTTESFGEDYELPNQRAYTETCASVGNVLWNHRMFLATGDGRYADVMEKILYNGFLSGVSLSGDSFFYQNPLESRRARGRSEYFDVACCPANLARLMAVVPGLVYARGGDQVWVNLYAKGEALLETDRGNLRISQDTDYPWNGEVLISLQTEDPVDLTLALRIPGWSTGAAVPSDLYRFADDGGERFSLRVNGETVDLEVERGYARITRRWRSKDTVRLELPMPVRRVLAHPGVREDTGKVALQRGPLVYALEGVDHGGRVLDLTLPAGARLEPGFRSDLLGGIGVITGNALRGDAEVPMLAIPYFAWANREVGEMMVWIPQEQ